MLSRIVPGRLSARTGKAVTVIAGHLSSFRQCDGGGVIMLIGLSIIPMALVLGLAVDSGLAYNARSKLQGAIDSAALAGAKKLSADEAEMKSEARMFFDANYPHDFLGGRVTDFDTDFNDDDREFSVDATIEVPTAFMRIAGIPTVTVTASAAVRQQLTSIELAMVLDVTGSMGEPDPGGGTKLEALKQASDTLLDVLFGDEDTAEGIAISVV
ncbi:MAG: pilus assembly protein TadG-related protein, partial [Geminicoccaceae bacterium]